MQSDETCLPQIEPKVISSRKIYKVMKDNFHTQKRKVPGDTQLINVPIFI